MYKSREEVMAELRTLNIDGFVACYNIFSEHNNEGEHIYSTDDFNELMDGFCDPLQMCFMMHYGSFNPHDDYWAFDGNGNLTSFATKADVWDFCRECFGEIADDILADPADYDFYVEVEVEE